MKRAAPLALLVACATQPPASSPLDVAITPGSPITGDALHVDAVQGSLTGARIAWARDGVGVGITVSDVPAGQVRRGERWSVDVTSGGVADSAAVTIGNAAPIGGVVSVTPSVAVFGEDGLRCQVEDWPTDADGDAVTVSLAWTRDGVAVAGTSNSEELPVEVVRDPGRWTCVATFDDGHGGTIVASAGALVGAAAPIETVQLQPGTFTMGVPETEFGRSTNLNEIQFEEPLLHDVRLTHAFEIGRYEVTRAEFLRHAGFDPTLHMDPCPQCPVTNASYGIAASFANALSAEAGLTACYTCSDAADGLDVLVCTGIGSPYECDGYRLPTEAEWEYAARNAGTTPGAFPGGQDATAPHGTDRPERCDGVPLDDGTVLDDQAWTCSNAGGVTHPVGQLAPNRIGLYDLSGNASEWVHDRLGLPGPEVDPWGNTDERTMPLQKGGAFNHNSRMTRVGSHWPNPETNRQPMCGFRIARTLPASEVAP